MAYLPSNDLTLDAEDADLSMAGVLDTSADSAATEGAADQTTPQPGQAGEAATETPDAQKTTDDWRKLLEDAPDLNTALTRLARSVSREDLLRDPTLAGIVGDAADKLERKRADQRRAEAEEAARAERERKLDEALDADDLLTLGELTAEERRAAREQRQREQSEQEQRSQGEELFRPVATATLNKFVDAQPPTIKAELQKLTSDRYASAQTWEDGYVMWLGDVANILANAKRPEWDKNTRDAIRKDELGRAEEEEPEATPEIGSSGTPNTSDLISQAVWEQNRGDRTWRMQNLDRIRRSVAAGSIRD